MLGESGKQKLTSVSGANSNARGQIQPQQSKHGAFSEKAGNVSCKNVPKVCKERSDWKY
jgi:hypothetical protein